jgi:hypothetical protein
MKPNDEKWTKADILQMLLAPRPKPAPPPKPTPTVVAQERWAKPKPIEAVVQEEAATNDALVERLREMQRAEARRAQYQRTIDQVWANQRAMQESLRELRSDPMGLWGPPTLASDLD